MTVLINIVLILASIVLIISVLMQEGNKQGLGAIGGAAETFLGKNKSKSYEGKLLTITKICAAVFVVFAIIATLLNARTYTVKYFYEDGTEFFPSVQAQADISYYLYGTETSYEELLASIGEDEARASYAYGDTVYQYSTPAKEGYVGKWDQELPEKMNRKNYELHPIYEIGTYTLTVNVLSVPDENGDTETTELYTASGLYESEIDVAAVQAAIDAVPEVEGYEKLVSAEVPATMPGYDTIITVSYSAPAEEEAPAEETESPVETEAVETEAPETEPVETETEPTESETDAAPETENKD